MITPVQLSENDKRVLIALFIGLIIIFALIGIVSYINQSNFISEAIEGGKIGPGGIQCLRI